MALVGHVEEEGVADALTHALAAEDQMSGGRLRTGCRSAHLSHQYSAERVFQNDIEMVSNLDGRSGPSSRVRIGRNGLCRRVASQLDALDGGRLIFAAACIVSPRIGASGLPAPYDVSRPNLDAAVVVALGVGVISWLLAAYALLRMRSAWRLRLGFALIAVAEVLAWGRRSG